MTRTLLIRNARCIATFDDADPVGALALCASPQAAYTIVNGRVIVHQGRLQTLEPAPLVTRHNTLAQVLAS